LGIGNEGCKPKTHSKKIETFELCRRFGYPNSNAFNNKKPKNCMFVIEGPINVSH
jgi:hypothetical protein